MINLNAEITIQNLINQNEIKAEEINESLLNL